MSESTDSAKSLSPKEGGGREMHGRFKTVKRAQEAPNADRKKAKDFKKEKKADAKADKKKDVKLKGRHRTDVPGSLAGDDRESRLAKDVGGVPIAYAHLYPKGEAKTGLDLQDTILWSPLLAARNGLAEVSFDLPDNVTTFRILVYGHTPDARLGVAHGKLVSQPVVAKP
jgi:hypothetical protein